MPFNFGVAGVYDPRRRIPEIADPTINPPQPSFSVPNMVGTAPQPQLPAPEQQQNNTFGGLGVIKQGTVFAPPPMQSNQTMQPDQSFDFGQRVDQLYKQIYTPETVEQERMQSHINELPVRQEPNMWRRLGSLFHGVGYGPEAQEAYKYRPYNRQMADWKAKHDPLYQSAQLERQQNISEQTMAYQRAQSEAKEEDLRIKGDAENRRSRALDENIRLREMTAQTNKFKAENPNWTTEEADGYIWLVNPQPNPGEPLKINTGLKTNEVDELTKHQWRLKEIAARGAQAQQTARVRAEENPSAYKLMPQIDANGNQIGMVVIKITEPGAPATPVLDANKEPILTGRTPNRDEINRLVIARADEFVNRYPNLKQFITVEDGVLTIKEGISRELRKTITDFIYGKPSERTNTEKEPPTPPPGVPPGSIPIIGPNGETYWQVQKR